MIQVRAGTIKSHIDIVATDLKSFIMQRLCNVTKEVYEELECLLRVAGGETSVSYALGVIGYRADAAACGATVSVVIDIAGIRWRIIGVDKVISERPLVDSCY